MKRSLNTMNILIYFILSLFYMETILRLSTTGVFFTSGLLFTFIFSISFAIALYIICTIFDSKINHVIFTTLLGLLAFIFSTQLVYYKFFRTFYTAFSAENVAQIFGLWRDISALILKNSILIILLFLPVIFIGVFRKKLSLIKRIGLSNRVLLIFCIIIFHVIGLAAIYASGRQQYSSYDLYFKSNNPTLSVERLGLLETMRIDLKRFITGWTPPLDIPPENLPAVLPDKTDKNKIEDKKIAYNTMNIDFDHLISCEKNKDISEIHKYFHSLQPTSKNMYTGKYKGYNLIFITAESFSPYAVREDITPTLYKMVHSGYNFTNFYNPVWGVSTTDGEYVACTGLIPKSGVWSFYESGSIYMPFTMGNQLKKLNYKTVAYHNHTYTFYKRNISHPNMGYTYKGLGNGLDVTVTWPESDLEMMEKTLPDYINSEPFHAYYMTVSGHLLYTFSGNFMARKNKTYVQNLPYSDPCKAYLSCQIELDRAMQYLLDQLERAGVADRTLIALSPDHYPYGLQDKEISELAGHHVEKNFELYRSTFILYTKGMKPVTIDKPCSSLDIIPTLSNLLGLEYDSRLIIGQDIFSDSEPLVIFQERSFITDKGRYNSKKREFISKRGVEVDKHYKDMISSIVNAKFYYSGKILSTDYYRKVISH